MEKQVEISKELTLKVGYKADKKAVFMELNYDGKFGYAKNESGIELVEILREVAKSTKPEWDDAMVNALDALIDKLSK